MEWGAQLAAYRSVVPLRVRGVGVRPTRGAWKLRTRKVDGQNFLPSKKGRRSAQELGRPQLPCRLIAGLSVHPANAHRGRPSGLRHMLLNSHAKSL